MIKFVVQDSLAGNVIDEFDSRDAAEAALREFEEEDKKNGIFEEDFYEIAEKKG